MEKIFDIIKAYHNAFDNMEEEGIEHQKTSAYTRYLDLTSRHFGKGDPEKNILLKDLCHKPI